MKTPRIWGLPSYINCADVSDDPSGGPSAFCFILIRPALTMKHKNGVTSTCNYSLASAVSYCVAVFGTNGIAETTRPSLDTFRFIPAPGADAEPETIDNAGFDPVKAGLER